MWNKCREVKIKRISFYCSPRCYHFVVESGWSKCEVKSFWTGNWDRVISKWLLSFTPTFAIAFFLTILISKLPLQIFHFWHNLLYHFSLFTTFSIPCKRIFALSLMLVSPTNSAFVLHYWNCLFLAFLRFTYNRSVGSYKLLPLLR